MPYRPRGKRYHLRDQHKASKRITKFFRSRRRRNQVTVLKKRVKKLEKAQEKKYRDSAMSLSMTSGHNIVDLGLGQINQGDGVHDREGSKILVNSLRIRGYINYADSVNKYRVIIFKVLDPDHTMPGIQSTDILESTDWYNSFYKRNSMVSFQILKDMRGWLNKPGYDTNQAAYQATSNPTHRDFTCNLNWKKGLDVRYDTSSAGYTIPTKNALYMLVMADSYASDHPDVNLVSRTTYVDS